MTSKILRHTGGNSIVALSSFTKRTKVINLTSSSFIDLTGTNLSGTTIVGAYIMAYADSNGLWRLRFNFALTATSGGNKALAYITLKSTYAVSAKFFQVVSGTGDGITGVCYSYFENAGSRVVLSHASSGENAYSAFGDIELTSEPTWAAANMESVGDVVAYIPPASATEAGILTTGAQTIGGVKNLSSHEKVSAVMTSAQSVNTGTVDPLTANWSDSGTDNKFDVGSAFNAATGDFTPTSAGYFLVSGTVAITTLADGKIASLRITKNRAGTPVIIANNQITSGAADTISISVSGLVYLNGSTDTVSLVVYHENGSARNCTGAIQICRIP